MTHRAVSRWVNHNKIKNSTGCTNWSNFQFYKKWRRKKGDNQSESYKMKNSAGCTNWLTHKENSLDGTISDWHSNKCLGGGVTIGFALNAIIADHRWWGLLQILILQILSKKRPNSKCSGVPRTSITTFFDFQNSNFWILMGILDTPN